MAKDRWNAEVYESVRIFHETDWKRKGREWVEWGENAGRAVVRRVRQEGEKRKEGGG